MVNDDDLVALAEDCVSICEVLRIGIEGKNLDDLSNLVKKAIVDLEECARSINSHFSASRNNGVFLARRTTSNGRSRPTPKETRSLGRFMPSMTRRKSKGGGRRSVRFWAYST